MLQGGFGQMHTPVMLQEAVDFLVTNSTGKYLSLIHISEPTRPY